jgi:hypothetical protein
MTRLRKVFTFSNVVACLALFMALGGTVYAAGKINGKQIQPSSIPGNRLKASSVATKQLKAKAVTPGKVKPNSLTGTQINESTLTGVTASRLASVQYGVATVALGDESTTFGGGTFGFAGCPPGTYVIGGGVLLSNNEYSYINDSGPTPNNLGWAAHVHAFKSGLTMTVTAICTAAASFVG